MTNQVARRKVGPARIAKSNHRFVKAKRLQDPEPSPVPEGSVEDEDREPTPTPTNNESSVIPDDTTVVGSTSEELALAAIPDEEEAIPDGPDVLLHAKKLDLCPRKQPSKVPQRVVVSDESSPEDSDYNDALCTESDNDNADKSSPAKPQQAANIITAQPPVPHPARKDKGKGTMLPVPADVEIDSDQDVVDDEQNTHTGNAPGRLPQEAIRRAAALGDETYAKASKIAEEYGKDVSTILIAAGLSTKATRGENPWNMYQSWYRIQFPKSPDVSTYDWKQQQRDHWRSHRDEREHPQLWKEIRGVWDDTMSNANKSSKAISARIMAVRDAFASSCEAYSRLEDIYVAGLVIYTGTDEGGRQASGIFGGSLVKDLINERQADLKQLIDYTSTVIKYKLIDDTASLPSFPQIAAPKFNPELSCEKGEGIRDRNRRVAPLMIMEKFEQVGIPHQGKNIAWKTMLNLLYTYKVQIVNWPVGVPPVGPDFVFKDLSTDELKALVVPYLKRCMERDYEVELTRVESKDQKRRNRGKMIAVKIPDEELKFEPWSDESKETFNLEIDDMLKIPLVTDIESKVLRTLMDSASFMKHLPDGVALPMAADPDVNFAGTGSSLPPSSPFHWTPSPPRPTRHQVSRPLPTTRPRPRPVPVPTKVNPRQPVVVSTRLSRPELPRSLTTRPDSYDNESRKAKRKRDDKSEVEDLRNSRRTKRSAIQHNSGDHRSQHRSRHTAHLPRNHGSPTPSPVNRSYHHSYQHSRSPVRHRYSYMQESTAAAGPSQPRETVDDAYDSEIYSDY